MTRSLEKHLDSDELDRLVSLQGASASGSEQLSEANLREAQRHVESCQECSRKLRRHQFVHSEILRMRAPNPSSPTPECRGDAEWLEVAAGLLPEAKTRELMKHAAHCGNCGPLLKNAAEILVDEATPSEEAVLASLGSGRPEWRKNMAATLRDSVRDPQPESSWWRAVFAWPTPAYALAGIAVAAIVGWVGLRMLRPPSATQLLAQAYSERRTMEVRIPGAKYAPMQAERGTQQSDFDKPQPLLKAEFLIAENLSKSPADPTWLQARARADLLDGNYESAIKALQQVLDLQPDSPSAMIDLASAYYRRASANEDRQVDYAVAIDYLGRALAKTPNDSLALFNRAICEEKLYLYDPARTDWQKYLTIDPVGPWAEEARKNLTRVEEKIKSKHASLLKPLLSAPDLISLRGREGWVTEMDGRVEAYLHLAVTQWLPEAFPQFQTQASLQTQTAHQALEVLAQVTRERHSDEWLADVLQEPHGPNFATGSALLAAALQANDHGDYLEANRDAQKAARLFRASGNHATELRAQVEELYSDHLLYEGSKCVGLGNRLSLSLRQHRYEWLRAQTSLESSMCAGLVGDQGTVRSATDRGTSEASDHYYKALALRGLGFQADQANDIGDTQRGVLLAWEGLEAFWDGDIDLMKGYNLYTDLDTAADTLHLPNLQVALWQQATELIDLHPDLVQRAMAHRFFAGAAYLANMPDLASFEMSKARDLFASAPPTEATARGKLDADIWQAGLEVRQGDLDRSDRHLRTAQAELEGHPSYSQELSFYETQAELRQRQHNSGGSESALRAAIFLAEWGLETFHTQNARHKWIQSTAGTYRNLVAWKLGEGDVDGALELWEWYRGAEFRAGISSSRALRDLDTALPPDVSSAPLLPAPTVVARQLPLLTRETIVVFGMLPEGTAVWVYDDRGISARWIGKSEREIRDRVAGFKELCSRRESSIPVLRPASRVLYDLLIGPIEDRITPGRTLVFEPDGILSDLPFEALVDPQGHYLVERAAVVTSPGLYHVLRLSPPLPINAETPALVVGVPAPFVEGVDPVVAAEREAQSVASHFRGAQSLEGTAATLAAIRRILPDMRVFHFAGHAVAQPDRNGLLLAEREGRSQQVRVVGADSLDPSIVRNLQLAVLSACATGVGSSSESSGTEGLSEAFLRSGVRSVIASRWNVDSEATAAFMEKFYANLLSGSDVSASLRAAQLQLVSQPEFSHPYYWAAFGDQGL